MSSYLCVKLFVPHPRVCSLLRFSFLLAVILMSSARASPILSASQLRRHRAAATKRKLYEDGNKEVGIAVMQYQLEALASTVNSIYLLLTGTAIHFPQHPANIDGAFLYQDAWNAPHEDCCNFGLTSHSATEGGRATEPSCK